WSSDVCSSDLRKRRGRIPRLGRRLVRRPSHRLLVFFFGLSALAGVALPARGGASVQAVRASPGQRRFVFPNRSHGVPRAQLWVSCAAPPKPPILVPSGHLPRPEPAHRGGHLPRRSGGYVANRARAVRAVVPCHVVRV